MKKETRKKVNGEQGIALMKSIIAVTMSLTLIGGQISLIMGGSGLIKKIESKQNEKIIKEEIYILKSELLSKCLEYKYIMNIEEDLIVFLEDNEVKIISDNEDGTINVEYKGYNFIIDKETLDVTEIENW